MHEVWIGSHGRCTRVFNVHICGADTSLIKCGDKKWNVVVKSRAGVLSSVSECNHESDCIGSIKFTFMLGVASTLFEGRLPLVI